MINTPGPNLITAYQGPLNCIERMMLDNVATIEAWFRQQWQKTPAPFASSVDLRHAGFKLAPIDTNLFPAGFNNLNSDSMPLCIQAAQAFLSQHASYCTKILLLPENHTRNQFYLKSLSVLYDILSKAGFVVRIGSLDPSVTTPVTLTLSEGEQLCLEPLIRQGNRIGLDGFNPCIVFLNNDLSSGVPDVLQDIEQPIHPKTNLGWEFRLKSKHFRFYDEVVDDFSKVVGLDPWLINPMFRKVENVDFMAQTGLESIAVNTDALLKAVQEKYDSYAIREKPFVAIKADNGTYGMSVMMASQGEDLLQLNRKQRTKMASGKGSRKVTKVIIQEGVYTNETMSDDSVAEPVVYMMGQYVVGGFYRVHEAKRVDENLNAPGMHFEPLAFAKPCNAPRQDRDVSDSANRFYVYGVIARLAALAAAREMSVDLEGDKS